MCSTVLSVGGYRQQFSVKENIEIALQSNRFFENINEEMEDDTIDLQIFKEGYLTIAGSKEGKETLKEAIDLQQSLGGTTKLINPNEIKQEFPWLNTDDISAVGYSGKLEGWFDPWSLLNMFRKHAKKLGVEFINGEVLGFESDKSKYKIKTAQCKDNLKSFKIEGNTFVNAAGCWSGYINDLMRKSLAFSASEFTSVPVVPKKRSVYVIKVSEENANKFNNVPLVFDSSRLWFRRDGKQNSQTFLVGKAPCVEDDDSYFWHPDAEQQNLKKCYTECQDSLISDDLFESNLWPDLAHRVPLFEECKVIGSWAGFYDFNLLDQNAIVGIHPEADNVLIGTGFSGHGIQQSPSIARGIAELFSHKKYQTIDLSALGLKRIKLNKPLLEKNCY